MFKQLGTFAILAVCLFALVCASVCPPVAADIWTSGKVVYTTNALGDLDIAVMGPNGGYVDVLTLSGDDEYDPTWSPDGTEILYVRSRFGSPEIWLMDANGDNQRKITSVSEHPSWLPTGNHFIARSLGANALAVYELNAARDGWSDFDFFIFDSDNHAYPASSPAEPYYIAYVADGPDLDRPWIGGSLYVYDLETERSTKIVSGSPGRGMSYPTWGPQGNRIVFSWSHAGFADGNIGVFTVWHDGDLLDALYWWGGSELYHPTVAPYGGELIYSRYDPDTGTRELRKATRRTNNSQVIGRSDATFNDDADWWHPSSYSVEPGASQLTTTWGSLKKKAK